MVAFNNEIKALARTNDRKVPHLVRMQAIVPNCDGREGFAMDYCGRYVLLEYCFPADTYVPRPFRLVDLYHSLG